MNIMVFKKRYTNGGIYAPSTFKFGTPSHTDITETSIMNIMQNQSQRVRLERCGHAVMRPNPIVVKFTVLNRVKDFPYSVQNAYCFSLFSLPRSQRAYPLYIRKKLLTRVLYQLTDRTDRFRAILRNKLTLYVCGDTALCVQMCIPWSIPLIVIDSDANPRRLFTRLL
jgi:hypothetical protein